jgi:hypothetical protein
LRRRKKYKKNLTGGNLEAMTPGKKLRKRKVGIYIYIYIYI